MLFEHQITEQPPKEEEEKKIWNVWAHQFARIVQRTNITTITTRAFTTTTGDPRDNWSDKVLCLVLTSASNILSGFLLLMIHSVRTKNLNSAKNQRIQRENNSKLKSFAFVDYSTLWSDWQPQKYLHFFPHF